MSSLTKHNPFLNCNESKYFCRRSDNSQSERNRRKRQHCSSTICRSWKWHLSHNHLVCWPPSIIIIIIKSIDIFFSTENGKHSRQEEFSLKTIPVKTMKRRNSSSLNCSIGLYSKKKQTESHHKIISFSLFSLIQNFRTFDLSGSYTQQPINQNRQLKQKMNSWFSDDL